MSEAQFLVAQVAEMRIADQVAGPPTCDDITDGAAFLVYYSSYSFAIFTFVLTHAKDLVLCGCGILNVS
jgi:hypothetical protein